MRDFFGYASLELKSQANKKRAVSAILKNSYHFYLLALLFFYRLLMLMNDWIYSKQTAELCEHFLGCGGGGGGGVIANVPTFGVQCF